MKNECSLTRTRTSSPVQKAATCQIMQRAETRSAACADAAASPYTAPASTARAAAGIAKRTAAFLLAAVLCLTAVTPLNGVVSAQAASTTSWGIIIGTTLHGNTTRVKNYKNIVVDVQHYYPNEIKKLKSGGRKVYSYMSIGSLEKYRPYYNRFKKYTLGTYENWSQERWMDVSRKEWQDFIVNELVASVRRKGCDGLWLDNTDVYYKYHRESIYKGLLNIITRIHQKGIPVYINGGDEFVSRLINSGRGKLIKGVFQEEVITSITSYGGNRFGRQNKSDRAYYEAYLRKVKRAGLQSAVLEYTRSSSIRSEIISFCKKNGYAYYIASDVYLR